MKYSKNHTVYYNDDGVEIPSVTTILKILNKPALVGWANMLGFKHLDVDSVVNESARLGTVVHDIINTMLSNGLLIYIEDDISSIVLYGYINRFKSWLSTHTVEPIFLEKSFSSEKFGGTIDCYGKIDGKLTLLDFKTSKKIRITMFFQLALYCILLEEKGYIVEQVGILLVNNKNSDEKYISREELQEYIDFVKGLVDIFHSYFSLNDKYKWGELLI